MYQWQWHHQADLPFLTCDLLEPWPHGFFTSRTWPQGPDTLVQALAPAASVHRVKQVHGDRVLTPTEMHHLADQGLSPSGERPSADGVLTDAAEQSVWVCSADCSPVLIGDRQTGQTAAVHAGWRGTALKVTPTAVLRMRERGSRLEDLVVAIGPAITGQVYQVSTQVAAEVGRTLVTTAPMAPPPDDPTLVQQFFQQDDSPIQPDPQPGRARLDVRLVNALQLQHLGLNPEQIAIAPHCTYQEPEQFFSYRRTQEKKVQWSGIVSR